MCLSETIATASQGTLPTGAVDFSHSNGILQVSSVTPERTTIVLEDAPINMLDTVVDFRTYQTFAIEGEAILGTEGGPSVPQVGRLYRIPNTGSAELVMTDMAFDVIDNVTALPVVTQEAGFGRAPQPDPVVYGSDQWYPPQPAVMSQPMIFRDFRVVQVTMYPVQVNPVTHQARVYRRLSAEVVANDSPGENELRHSRRISGAFAPMYRTMIANLDDNVLDDATTTPGSILFLCRTNANSRQCADTLAYWKRRLGYTVTVDTFRTAPSAQTMKSHIQDLYDVADPPLEFVCIVGDPDGGTTYQMATDGGGMYDHYFARLDGNDDLEDVGIGRLPAQNATEYTVMQRKVFAYERNPYMADTGWFHRAFLYCEFSGDMASNGTVMYWSRQQFIRRTGVDSAYVLTHFNWADEPTITEQLNHGVCYFLWRGSFAGQMSTTAADGPTNGTKLPIVLTITCGTGDFDWGECLSEAWIKAGTANNLRGGVCGIATATAGTHVQYNNTVVGGFTYAICDQKVEHLGLALASAKAQLLSSFADATTLETARNFVYWNNLMGDPSLSMWTDVPVIMDVTYPDSLNVGARQVHVEVIDSLTGAAIPKALVVLWKDTECYVTAQTDSLGWADLPVTVNSTGTMSLTVSKYNHKPYLADLPCVEAEQMLGIASFALDDGNAAGTSGNNDHQMNPGEIIDLQVYLKNFGTINTATGISATLTSDNPRITVVTDTASYGDLAPHDSLLGATPFRIQVSPMMGHRETALFTLDVHSDGGLVQGSFRLSCRGGETVFASDLISGGNGNTCLDPGETADFDVTVRNTGVLTMSGVSGTLHSLSNYVAVTTADAPYGTLNVDGILTNTTHFGLTANEKTYRGHLAHLFLVLTSTEGYVDTVYFSLVVGTRTVRDPTGPDAYGYFAYEDEDTAYEMHRDFHYDSINVTGRGTRLAALNDPGNQSAGDPIYSTVRTLPFTFRFYGEDYTRITICSNGWAAFGDQDDFDMFRNYPIPGEQAPDAMIAPFWDDLATTPAPLGVWDYYEADSDRYIIQWKASIAGGIGGTTNDFEVILLDQERYPTRDGNGIVVVQYKRVEDGGTWNDIPYSTMGIEAPGCTVGLQYRFDDTAAPGAITATNGIITNHCVVYTTEAPAVYGNVSGTVTDAATLLPLPGVCMSIAGQNFSDTTDVAGHYELTDIVVGTYTALAHKAGYNDYEAQNVVILLDTTIVQDFALTHPEFSFSAQQIAVTVPTEPANASFDVTNNGNGPLDYRIHLAFSAGQTLDDAWDYATGIDVTAATQDHLIEGCEFVGDYWWVTGGGGQDGGRYFYRFDLQGNYVDAIPQPTDQGVGWYDLAYDGQWVYGSNSRYLFGVDSSGTIRDTIPTPLNPTRAVAYDPATEHFWVGDYNASIAEIDRQGTVIRRLPSPCNVTGLAWNASDETGYNLYVYGTDPVGAHAQIRQMNPVSGESRLIGTLDRQAGDRAAGCAITSGWNSALMVFAGILQNATGDRLGIWELDFNTSWIQVTPTSGHVAPASSQTFRITFDPATLRNSTYYVNLEFLNNTAAGVNVLPVALTVDMSAAGDRNAVPLEYRLHQNYPNPFNNATTFRYDLKHAGQTALKVYNLLGEEVATVVNRFEEAGAHSVNFEMRGLASGVYLYRLESGSFVQTRKLVLIR
jgi:hypothetical protein